MITSEHSLPGIYAFTGIELHTCLFQEFNLCPLDYSFQLTADKEHLEMKWFDGDQVSQDVEQMQLDEEDQVDSEDEVEDEEDEDNDEEPEDI